MVGCECEVNPDGLALKQPQAERRRRHAQKIPEKKKKDGGQFPGRHPSAWSRCPDVAKVVPRSGNSRGRSTKLQDQEEREPGSAQEEGIDGGELYRWWRTGHEKIPIINDRSYNSGAHGEGDIIGLQMQ
uniref:Uncharacterized protein n=1 Tax=Branchiostoma floridae TaxID=7739 RepID=C3Z1J8_BRAFL|eukprot:XP_002597604.1 hypothetical protein BRAFLDRAFT_82293 [Branchiostoma floridae]